MHPQVSFTRLKISGRMIVGENHGGSSVGNNICKDLAGVNWAIIEQPNRHNSLFYDFIRSIERDAQEILLLLASNVGHERQDVLGAADFQGILDQVATSKFKG